MVNIPTYMLKFYKYSYIILQYLTLLCINSLMSMQYMSIG